MSIEERLAEIEKALRIREDSNNHNNSLHPTHDHDPSSSPRFTTAPPHHHHQQRAQQNGFSPPDYKRSRRKCCAANNYSYFIHFAGLERIFSSGVHPARRIFWAILVFLVVGMFAFQAHNVTSYYLSAPLHVTYQENEKSSLKYPVIIISKSVIKNETISLFAEWQSNGTKRVFLDHSPINYGSPTDKREYYFINHLRDDLLASRGPNDLLEINMINTSSIINIQLSDKHWMKKPPVKQNFHWMSLRTNRRVTLWITAKTRRKVMCRASTSETQYNHDTCIFQCLKEQGCPSSDLAKITNIHLAGEPKETLAPTAEACSNHQYCAPLAVPRLDRSKCRATCLPECEQTEYKTTIDEVEIPQGPVDVLKLIIRYRTLTVEDLQETFAFNWFQFLSEIGGSLTFCLGACLLTIIQALDALLIWICSRTCRKKNHNYAYEECLALE